MFPNDSDFDAMVSLETERTGVIDEPPFHILMIGDWSGDGAKREMAERKPLVIDRDDFDAVMARLDVRLELEAENGNILLEFNCLDDFHPDEIFQKVPMFSELRDLRKRLASSDSFNLAAREVRAWDAVKEATTDSEPESETSNEPEPADNLLDAILSKPDGGAPPPKYKATNSPELSNLISDLVRPHLVSVNENEQTTLLAAVDAATGDLMRNIIQHPKFKELEAAWRGLFLLVNRVETSVELKIFLLDAGKDELVDEIKAGEVESRLYKVLVPQAVEPWTAVFANYNFSPNVDDIAALIRIGKIAQVAKAPFVSQMAATILGIESLAATPDAANWNGRGDSNEAKLWAALRGQPEAASLAMTVNRFLARLPYGKATDPLERFDFEELSATPQHDNYLWANSCFLTALLLSQGFAEYGWSLGGRLLQDVERMPTHIYTIDGEAITKPCAEIQLSQMSSETLMEFGIMPYVSFKDSDRIRLTSWQSIADPIAMLKGRWA